MLEVSAQMHCPDWIVTVDRIDPPPCNSPLGIPGHVVNMQKFDHWVTAVLNAADGDRLLLVDADTFVVNALDPLWQMDFDVAYTVRSGHPFPLNAGVIALRVSPSTRAFMTAWQAENRRMLTDPHYHRRWRIKFGGLNQSAFGKLLAEGALNGLHVVALPCAIWNCEDSAWHAFDPDVTRIVHVKSALRRAIFGPTAARGLAPLVARWRAMEAQLPERATA